jgi:hypothetical protein
VLCAESVVLGHLVVVLLQSRPATSGS